MTVLYDDNYDKINTTVFQPEVLTGITPWSAVPKTKADKMTIALDFDETYNRNPWMWDRVIDTMRNNGQLVVLATYRHPVEDYDPLFDRLKQNNVVVIFTDGKAKKPFLEAIGIKVDVWIDDNPKSILEDSAWGKDSPELRAWREANKVKA